MIRPMSPGQLAFDIGFAVVCWGFALLVYTNGVAGNLFVATGMALALALRRLSPVLALGIAWATSLAQVLLLIGPDLSNLAILPILYATARYGTPAVKWAGLGSTGAGALVVALYSALAVGVGFRVDDGTQLFLGLPQAIHAFLVVFLLVLAVFALSWTLGLLARTWRNAREASTARILAERHSLNAQQSVAVEQERNRIARDMHDVVAHSLAVVIAQADGARYAGAKDPAVQAALVTISTTAREALGEVRVLLGSLRHSQDAAPQPVLADLDRLFGQFRAAGLEVRFTESGDPLPLGTGAQLAVYRIAQEALTNALRHGESDQGAEVSLDWRVEAIALEVSSALAAESKPSAESGHGIAGMVERAALAGGRLTAAAAGERFVVAAEIPARAEVPA
jgi:signal transduction histidine kinase